LTNFLNEHNTRVKSRIPILKYDLDPGMIIKCRYSSQDMATGEYILVVLNPSYKGHLHALSLNEFNSRTFLKLANKLGTTELTGPRFKNNNILALDIDMNPRTIYEGFLKKGMDKEYNTSYRTLDIKKMSGIMLLEYKL